DEYGIEAAMWIGFPGSDGIRAVAEVLAGKVNPSGGLSAAWYTSREANPSTQNYAISNFSNIVNMEGMYVGYRYAETRYEDVLLNSENAGTYNYGTQISYPFGYGLSYTTFSYSEVKVVKDNAPAKNYYSGGLMASNDKNYSGNYGKLRPEDERRATGDDLGDCDDLIVEVTVTNTGKVAGKEIVQIYLQQAEAATDKEHGVQKPSVQLVGYGKTSLLAPNQSETVKINIDANKWFAAYDATLNGGENYTGGGYVLAEGDYHLAAARNSHEAVNSIYLKKGGTAANTYINKEYGDGNAANVATVHVDAERSASYKYWTQGTTDEVRNLFQDVAPNTDMVFSRYDWNKTAAITGGRIGASGKSVSGSANTGAFSKYGPITSDEITAYAEYYDVKFNENAYEFGSSTSTWKLVDLIGVEYDPARGASEDDVRKWSELVGQLTKNEFIDFFKDGLRQTRGIDSIGKPGTNDQNASNGLEWAFGYNDEMGKKAGNEKAGFMYAFDSNSKKCYPTGYPCEGIIAATFNNELAYRVGRAIGADALWAGAAGLYGFGLGLQRNPYHGRAGEFYSDDSFLTGMMGAMETLGAQEKGLYVYNKHFVLNDQETNRTGYKAWIDEQTFRQIYLRPFEMAIEIGDAMNVMIAFNKLGTGWTGNSYNLMTRWLRGEAGMAGFAISDYYAAPGENLGAGMLSGVCLLDGAISTTSGDVVGSLGDARYD
ncbi:MAG: glycoside hydrolase family 3 C-terminal domain-containing protein, partial [Clostridia bacterium]|nr:glycoside hydrolase family 3 C-terminal domain-containing protein [Clostridia bacterium]